MWGYLLVHWLQPYTEAIGFWAALCTTLAFTPQLIQAWRTGEAGLSWAMLALFGTGVWLWFLYGVMRMSGPVMAANGFTGLQVLLLAALKFRRASDSSKR